jgi:Toprim domain-containing protein
VHLAAGAKRGVWADFGTGQKGDALDLVAATLQFDTSDAIGWARTWLRLDDGEAALPRRPAPPAKPEAEQQLDPDRWQRAWQAARPIVGTLAATYLAARGLAFDDPDGRVLRFAPRRARKNADDMLEHHPALLALLSDVGTGKGCGIKNIYLRADGSDRLRDSKAKTSTGKAGGAAAMLSAFDEPTYGLTVCEGPETGIALLMHDLAPVWSLDSAGNLGSFPVLSGIGALTIAADPGTAGQQNAAKAASRWRAAGRKALVITPPAGDWADPKRGAST